MDFNANRRYLLDKTQHIIGGFAKMPGDPPGKPSSLNLPSSTPSFSSTIGLPKALHFHSMNTLILLKMTLYSHSTRHNALLLRPGRPGNHERAWPQKSRFALMHQC